MIKLKLTPKLTLVFVSFAAALLTGVSLIGYYRGRFALQAAAIHELEATAGEKEAAVTAWVHEKQSDVAILSVEPSIAEALLALETLSPRSREREVVHDWLIAELEPRVAGGEFLDLFLLDPKSGRVLLGVEPGREGQSKADRAYFLEGKKGSYTTPIYYSPELRAPTMLAAAPVLGESGTVLAVLAGRLNLHELNTIVQRRSGLRETDDAFLVNASRLLVTQPRFLTDPAVLQQGINIVPVNLCVQRKRGVVFANDYRKVPVVASYRWMPEHQMCLIVEISQAEAFAPIHDIQVSMTWIVLAVLAVATAVAHALSRTIVHPILSMQAAVQRYGRGDLEVRLPETRRDELGVLAHEVNQMAGLLAQKERDLEEHARTLEQKVQERTRALQETSSLLQRAEETGQVGSWLWDVPENTLVVSEGLYRLLGFPAPKVNTNLEEFLQHIHPQDQERMHLTAATALHKSGSFDAEFRIVLEDGQVRIVYARGESLLDEHGTPLRMNGVLIDITERKETETQLADAHEFMQHILTSAPIGIFTYRLSGECLSANAAAAKMVGATVEQLERQNFRELESWKRSGLYDLAEHAIVSKELTAADVHILTTFGRDAWYRAKFLTFKSKGEEILLMIFEDITERKQAEETLQEKEHLLSEAQRIGHIGSWSYDVRSDTLTFSDEMYRLLDILPEEFHHHSSEFLALVYPSDRPTAARWMADIREGTQARDLSFRLFHKNGELCYLYSTGAGEYDTAGRAVRFIGTTQDVTEHRVAEIQINQQLKRLTALSEIDRAIISSFDQTYTLGVIVANAISQLQVDAAAVLVLEPEGETLDYAAGQGFRTKLIEGARVPLGEIHAGRAAKERRMIRIPDLRETTNTVPFSQFVMAEGFVSYVGAPLIVKGKVKGVLEVYQRSTLQPYQDWLAFFNALAGQTAIAIENTSLFKNLQSTNQELTQAYDATIEGWSRAMDLRDRETAGHTQRVTRLTIDLARVLGMDESRLIHIRRGALLHDIGKLGIPDHILFKPGELTVEERKIIETHTDHAYDMLAPIPYLKPALNIPYFHHEKWDGTGYPLGLKGEQIPLEARLFAVVDVWDALLSDRPHHKAWSRPDVLEYIRLQAGTHFDPRVVDCFLEMINKIA